MKIFLKISVSVSNTGVEDKSKGAGGGEPPVLGDFWKFVTKIMHFRHISVKIKLKNPNKTWNNISIGGEGLGLPGYAVFNYCLRHNAWIL